MIRTYIKFYFSKFVPARAQKHARPFSRSDTLKNDVVDVSWREQTSITNQHSSFSKVIHKIFLTTAALVVVCASVYVGHRSSQVNWPAAYAAVNGTKLLANENVERSAAILTAAVTSSEQTKRTNIAVSLVPLPMPMPTPFGFPDAMPSSTPATSGLVSSKQTLKDEDEPISVDLAPRKKGASQTKRDETFSLNTVANAE